MTHAPKAISQDRFASGDNDFIASSDPSLP